MEVEVNDFRLLCSPDNMYRRITVATKPDGSVAFIGIGDTLLTWEEYQEMTGRIDKLVRGFHE